MHGEVAELVVAHRDRLCRFAFELIELICRTAGTELIVLDNESDRSPDADLADDILSIIHIYAYRKNERRKNKEDTNLSDDGTENHTEGVVCDE
jgi:predicted site-specific integrase-resolvase